MKNIKLEKFRCFHSEQSVPLAPLTFLVGENSTGKTSFMALIHAMYGVMTGTPPADSWADPYGFSTFSQAVNDKTGPEEIGVSFGLGLGTGRDLKCDFSFQSFDNSPLPVATRLKHNDVWVEVKAVTEGHSNALRFGTEAGSWQIDEVQFPDSTWPSQLMQVLAIILEALPNRLFRPLGDSFPITDDIKSYLLEFQKMFTPEHAELLRRDDLCSASCISAT